MDHVQILLMKITHSMTNKFNTLRECLNGLDFQTDADAGLSALSTVEYNYNQMKLALETLSKLGNGDIQGNSLGNQIAIDALNKLL